MQLFYTPDIQGLNYRLNNEESKHCVKVLRLKEGDLVHLIDGRGSLYEAKITDANHKACALQIVGEIQKYGKRNFRITIAIAPTKNMDRLEWFLEKATEIGVDQIIPIICHHSERKEVKLERMEKVVVAAMKQSYKAYMPVLMEAMPFKELLKLPFSGARFIAHCEEGEKKLLKNQINPKEDVMILIGPEGDFSKEEIDQAIAAGFVPVSLGESRLRTETAGVVACHTVHLMNE